MKMKFQLLAMMVIAALAFIACGDDDKKIFEFYNYIKCFPSQLGLELSDEKSVFAHVFDNTPK